MDPREAIDDALLSRTLSNAQTAASRRVGAAQQYVWPLVDQWESFRVPESALSAVRPAHR